MKLKTLKPRVREMKQSRVRVLPANPNATPRIRGRAWMEIRDRILSRDAGLCQYCLEAGRVTVATEVDHRTPLHLGGSNEDDNLVSTCHDCHEKKTAEEAAERSHSAVLAY